MFYKATVQVVLLYANETWNIPRSALATLEGFHIGAAQRMTNMMPWKRDESWEYLQSPEVL